MIKRTQVFFILVYLLIVGPENCYSKSIKMGVTKSAYESPHGQFMEVLYSEIFKKLGHSLELVILPPIRLALITSKGGVDGELIRVANYGKSHPELAQVKEECFKFNIFAYALLGSRPFSYKDNKVIVGYRKGVVAVEQPLQNSFTAEKLRSFTDMNQALEQLMHNRINYYIGIEHFVDDLLRKRFKKSGDKIVKLNKVGSNSAHMYLTKPNSALAPLISRELKLMKKSGRYKNLKQKYLTLR